MAATRDIPTVTTDDLLDFHKRTFGKIFTGSVLGDEEVELYEEDYYEDEDDSLGYYPDGTKRTLTDEQIAIFRHSEIQRLLLKHRREAEEAAELEADGNADAESVLKAEVSEEQTVREESSDEGEVEEDDEDDAYEKFLEAERKQFAKDAKKKRGQIREKQQQKDSQDRTVSTRRRVRELDDGIKQQDIVLDY